MFVKTKGIVILSHGHADHVSCLGDFFNEVKSEKSLHLLKEFNPQDPILFTDKDGVWQYEFPGLSVYIDPGGLREEDEYILKLARRARIFNTIATPETLIMMDALKREVPNPQILLAVNPELTQEIPLRLELLDAKTTAKIRFYTSKHTIGSMFSVIDYPEVSCNIKKRALTFSGVKVAHLLDGSPADYRDITHPKNGNSKKLRADILSSQYVTLDAAHILRPYYRKNRRKYGEIFRRFQNGIPRTKTKNPKLLVYSYISAIDTIKYISAVVWPLSEKQLRSIKIYVAGGPHVSKRGHLPEPPTSQDLVKHYISFLSEKLNIPPDCLVALPSLTPSARIKVDMQTGKPLSVEELENREPEIKLLKRRVAELETKLSEAIVPGARKRIKGLLEKQNEALSEVTPVLKNIKDVFADEKRSILLFTWGHLTLIPRLADKRPSHVNKHPHIFLCERSKRMKNRYIPGISTEYNVVHHAAYSELFEFLRFLLYAPYTGKHNNTPPAPENGNYVQKIILSHLSLKSIGMKFKVVEGSDLPSGKKKVIKSKMQAVLRELIALGEEAREKTGKRIMMRAGKYIIPVEDMDQLLQKKRII